MRIVRAGPFEGGVCAKYRGLGLSSTIDGPPNGKYDRYEMRIEMTPGESQRSVFDATVARLMSYDVFPRHRLRAVLCPGDTVTLGTTIVQRVRFGPVCLESGVRVVDVWDRVETAVRSAGFAYVTLDGHPEKGVATFAVETRRDDVWIVLTARSIPGTNLTQLGRPFVRLAQKMLTKSAVSRLSRQIT